VNNQQRRETLLLITEKLNACIVQILSLDDETYDEQINHLLRLIGLNDHSEMPFESKCSDVAQQLVWMDKALNHDK